ncbi:MAG: hypothetical protein KJ718_02740 [Nanoarchaeota archaeon]|nr:hypothetical protein [Nanoarchaeota archaeon]MBU1051447.1 hypothetical protein [Nanoarchaeota archaeon]MBU1987893.1 hypothetical protein [Nanoarchaeota archaeon]
MKKEDKIKKCKRILKQVEKELAEFRDKKKWFERERETYIKNLKSEIKKLEKKK